MEFRNMIQTVFNWVRQPAQFVYYKMLNDSAPIFSNNYKGKMWDDKTVRESIDAIARHIGKLKAKHIIRANGDIEEKKNSSISWLLTVQPNQYMDAYNMWYKMAAQLYCNNNAYMYIHYDQKGNVEGFYPLNFDSVEIVEYEKEMYCRFTFGTGFRMTVPYTDIIHLRRHFNDSDFFGATNRPFMLTLSILKTIQTGIVSAIKNSGRLRGIIKVTDKATKPETLKIVRDQFVTNYMNINNSGGIGALPSNMEFTATDVKQDMIDADTQKTAREEVYNYFGISPKIVTGQYNEDEWDAFYESIIEPFAIQASLQLTSKIFSRRELGFGNQIFLEANRLQYASTKTKISLVKELMPLGVISINQALEIFNMAPVEGGEKRLISLNYVDSELIDKYQLNKIKDLNDLKNDEGVKNNEE